MADVTVNIRGNASQLRNELDNVGNISSPSTSTARNLPTNDRMIEDIRREMQQRGVVLVPGSSSMTQLINQYGQAQKGEINDRISEKYEARREDMRKRMSADYDAIEEDIERRREARLSIMGNPNDPLALATLDRQLEQYRDAQYRRVGTQYDDEENKINQDEKQERIQSENELTNAIKELTEYFNRQSNQGEDSDSYIGRLKAQQRNLIYERDTAETEEGAMAASRKLSDVNEQLRKVLNGGVSVQGRPYYDSMLQGSQGLTQFLSAMQRGDIGGGIMGGAGAIAGLSGMGLSTALRFLGWAGVIAGGAQWLSGASDTSESLSGLSAFRSTAGGYGGINARHYLGEILPGKEYNGYSYTDYGLKIEEFAEQARRRIASRGMADNWYEETMRQIGLERSLALSEGSLERGGKYDRYGQNVTDAVSRLVTILSEIEGSGVSYNDFTRVQEKYDIQQSIMSSYLGRTDKPNYDVANRTLAAFSSVQGITQDSRIGGDIEQFQKMVQSPINERMKVLVYSTVADLFPETGGRMDLIDRALRNPENEGKIMQAVIQRIVSQFGGPETTYGYYAFKNLLPNISPDRIDAYVKAFTSGRSADIMTGVDALNQRKIEKIGSYNKDLWAKEATGFTTEWSKSLKNIEDYTKQIAGKITGTRSMPKNVSPRRGGD